jgi:hypothetical protein
MVGALVFLRNGIGVLLEESGRVYRVRSCFKPAGMRAPLPACLRELPRDVCTARFATPDKARAALERLCDGGWTPPGPSPAQGAAAPQRQQEPAVGMKAARRPAGS